jgi:exodeoxyribonuclease V alpha subunit
MVTKNQPEHNIFNGDIGIVKSGTANSGAYACFWKNDTEYNKVPLTYIAEYETAYAMTIHKSQGSEFDEVLIVFPETENQLLTRELLYTAITRAKRKVTIMGDRRLVLLAVSRTVKRISGIREKLASVI